MKQKLDLKKLTTYLIPVGSLLIGLAIIPLVIFPQLQEIVKSSAIINDNKSSLAKVENKAEKLEKYAEDKEKLENDLKFVETVLPINKDVAALVSGVQELARQSGLSINSFKIQPGKTATDSAGLKSEAAVSKTPNSPQSNVAAPISSKDNLVFNMSMSGELQALRTFLRSLETGKRILTLSQVKSVVNSSSIYNFDLFLNAPFSILPKFSPNQAKSPLAELTEKNRKLLEDLRSPIFSDITNRTVTPGPTGPTNPFKGN